MSKRSLLVLIAIIGWQFACAQFMPGQVTGRGMIVMNPDCAKELKITKDQQKKFEQALKDIQTKIAAGDYSGFDLSNPYSALDSSFESILDESQKTRLEELFVQKNLGFALTDKRTAGRLELTEEQVAEVKRIHTEAKPELAKLMQNLRSKGDVDKLKAKESEVSVMLLALLTPEQTTKFETFKGKAFKFKA